MTSPAEIPNPSRNRTRRRGRPGENQDLILFQGHRDPLSNLAPLSSPLMLLGQAFPTVEHAYQYLKMCFLNKAKGAEKIRETDSPYRCMHLGNKVTPREKERWLEGPAYSVMQGLVIMKLIQDRRLQGYLYHQKGKRFVELTTNPIWGAGPQGFQNLKKLRAEGKLHLPPGCLDGRNWMGRIYEDLSQQIEPNRELESGWTYIESRQESRRPASIRRRATQSSLGWPSCRRGDDRAAPSDDSGAQRGSRKTRGSSSRSEN